MGRIYSPLCTVCQYMKQNKAFTRDIILSSYFDPNGAETMADVNIRHNEPFMYQTLYKHAVRHMKPAISEWKRLHHLIEKSTTMTKADRAKEILNNTMEAVEAKTESHSEHEDTLDLMIKRGKQMIETGEIRMTAQTLNAAIKTKAEIENKNKDRRYDALKSLFAGAAPKKEVTDASEN